MLTAQGLLQDKLSAIRLLGDQKGQHTTQSVTVADCLEYVDALTGFTPLLAAIFYHNMEAAKLVSCVSSCAKSSFLIVSDSSKLAQLYPCHTSVCNPKKQRKCCPYFKSAELLVLLLCALRYEFDCSCWRVAQMCIIMAAL